MKNKTFKLSILFWTLLLLAMNLSAEPKQAYFMKNDSIVFKIPIADIDSIIFQEAIYPVLVHSNAGNEAYKDIENNRVMPFDDIYYNRNSSLTLHLQKHGSLSDLPMEFCKVTSSDPTVLKGIFQYGSIGFYYVFYNDSLYTYNSVKETEISLECDFPDNFFSKTVKFTVLPTGIKILASEDSLTAKTSGTARYPVASKYFEAGKYRIEAPNLPSGLEIGSITSEGVFLKDSIEITELHPGNPAGDGKGTFVVRAKRASAKDSTYTHTVGSYPTLNLNVFDQENRIHFTSFGLEIIPLPFEVHVGKQSNTVYEGKANFVEFPVTTSKLEDGRYAVSILNMPDGFYLYHGDSIDIQENKGVIALQNPGPSEHSAGNYKNLQLVIEGTESPPFSLVVTKRVAPTDIHFQDSVIYTWHYKTENLNMTLSPKDADPSLITWEKTLASNYITGSTIDDSGDFYAYPLGVDYANKALYASYHDEFYSYIATLPNGVSKSVQIRPSFKVFILSSEKHSKGFDSHTTYAWSSMVDSLYIGAYYAANEEESSYSNMAVAYRYFTPIPNSEYSLEVSNGGEQYITISRNSDGVGWDLKRHTNELVEIELQIKMNGAVRFVQSVTLLK